ncbi:MAG: hypothetical protein HY960_11185 [Ignavibacteriae bacterium]|nr:hypothetical protein [Ignavibacteriota bacterium]
MIKKIVLLVVGLLLCGGVVYLGIHATDSNWYIIAFGLASALVAPVGLSAIGYVFQKDDNKLLEKLSKVPELERLAAEAQSKEEKIKTLEKERETLLEIIQFEAQKAALIDKRKILESEAQQILTELDNTDQNLAKLDVNHQPVLKSKEMVQLYERLKAEQKGDIVFRIGKQYFRFSRLVVNSIPFGNMAWHYLELANWIHKEISKLANQQTPNTQNNDTGRKDQ